MPDKPQPDNDDSQLPPISDPILGEEQPLAEPAGNTNRQFRISTLLSWTAVVAILLAFLRIEPIFSSGSELQFSWREVLSQVFFVFVFFAAPLTCVPVLIDHLIAKKGGLVFSLFWRIWLTICLAIYSMLMLMLATIAFWQELLFFAGKPIWFTGRSSRWSGQSGILRSLATPTRPTNKRR